MNNFSRTTVTGQTSRAVKPSSGRTVHVSGWSDMFKNPATRIQQICSNVQPVSRGKGTVTMPAFMDDDNKRKGGLFGGRKTGIVWMTSNLRVHDNAVLAKASNECSSVLPVFCFDPADYPKASEGAPLVGPHKASCLLPAIKQLREKLHEAGNKLVVRVGKPEQVLVEITKKIGTSAVYCVDAATKHERAVQERVKRALGGEGAKLERVMASTLIDTKQLQYDVLHMPNSFAQFKSSVASAVKKCEMEESKMKGAPAGSVEEGEIPTLDVLGYSKADQARAKKVQLEVGEDAAQKQLSHFLQEAEKIMKGGAHAAGNLSRSYNKHVSTAVAMGYLSARGVYQEASKKLPKLLKKESNVKASGWLLDTLLHRDFTQLLTMKATLEAQAAASKNSNKKSAKMSATSRATPAVQAVPAFA